MKIIILILLFTSIVACGDGRADRVLDFYKDTDCYELAKAVYYGDVDEIEEIVTSDTTLLSCSESTSGTTILTLAILAEQMGSLKKLLELGTNPNSINTLNKYSVLIESITFYGSQFEWKEHIEFTELLLKYGADPNYKVDTSFTNKKGYNVYYESPMLKAVSMNLDYVKLLLKYGADYKQKVNDNPIFYYSVLGGSIDIINYFVDSLNVDLFQVLDIYGEDTLYIQDCIHKFMDYKEGSKSDLKKIELIKKLENKGVNFKDHNYKLK